MGNLKVHQLDNWMKFEDEEDLQMAGYPNGFPRVPDGFRLIGRDGYYCYGNSVWFEWKGNGYKLPTTTKADFVYGLKVNDETILPTREAQSMRNVLKTTRDAHIRKVLKARLQLHDEAVCIRSVYRGASRWKLRRSKDLD